MVGYTGPYAHPEQRFHRLAATWRLDTAGLSSPSAITRHPAYQEIIAVGQADRTSRTLGYILMELAHRGGLWWPALRALTGADPVPESAEGHPDQVAAAWLKWGADRGFGGLFWFGDYARSLVQTGLLPGWNVMDPLAEWRSLPDPPRLRRRRGRW